MDAPTSTDLALDRTRLAHDRTLMAWIQGQARQGKLLGPREFALLM